MTTDPPDVNTSDDGASASPAQQPESAQLSQPEGAVGVGGRQEPIEPDQSDVVLKTLDLTDEAPSDAKAHVDSKSIDEKREDTRSLMAVWLLVGLAAVSIAWLAVGVWGDPGDVKNAGQSLDQIFTGILGLTGTAVGFYFGSSATGSN